MTNCLGKSGSVLRLEKKGIQLNHDSNIVAYTYYASQNMAQGFPMSFVLPDR